MIVIDLETRKEVLKSGIKRIFNIKKEENPGKLAESQRDVDTRRY